MDTRPRKSHQRDCREVNTSTAGGCLFTQWLTDGWHTTQLQREELRRWGAIGSEGGRNGAAKEMLNIPGARTSFRLSPQLE